MDEPYRAGGQSGLAARIRRRALVVAASAAVVLAGIGGYALWANRTDAGLDSLAVTQFGFEVAGKFEPPPDGGFWMPMDIAIADGRVWIVDYGAARIYRYAPDGRYEGTFGKSGRGPGELQGPTAIGAVGDTIWVLNTGNARIDYFDTNGRIVGSQPLPQQAEGANHMVSVGGDFVATTLFQDLPLLRFPRRLDQGAGGDIEVTVFGQELAGSARSLQGQAQHVPPSYRIQRRGDKLWVAHLYLPVIGVYDTMNTMVDIITYPAPPIESGRIEVNEDGGVRRRVITGPEPAGTMALLWAPNRTAYLLTQQKGDGDEQRLFQIAADGTLLGRTLSPLPGPLVFAAAEQGTGYAIGALERGGTPEVYILRWTGGQ
ncbi:MAG TPA: hypothetical protein VF188_16650 [Longimicrobiales bacterium]